MAKAPDKSEQPQPAPKQPGQRPACAAAPGDMAECPRCAQAMRLWANYYRCANCGYKESCCF